MVVEHQAVHFTNVHFENCCLYVKAGASAKLTDTHFTMSEDSSVGVSLLLGWQCQHIALYYQGGVPRGVHDWRGQLHAC